jgi:predicted Fe-Mo cluster-binding NifX family protein
MSKIGLTVLLNRGDSTLSPHFGKAKWVAIRDLDSGAISFEQNQGLNGRTVVDVLIRNGCTDAIFSEIGPGALRHLHEAGIQGWFGPLDVPMPELAHRLVHSQLSRALAPSPGHGAGGGRECDHAHSGGGHAGGCCK